MKLELMIDGEEKTFTANATGRHHRQLMKYDEQMDYSDIGVKQVDELVDFVCDVFRNQFTSDQFYDGTSSHELQSIITSVFAFVRTGKTPEELEQLEKEVLEQANKSKEVDEHEE